MAKRRARCVYCRGDRLHGVTRELVFPVSLVSCLSCFMRSLLSLSTKLFVVVLCYTTLPLDEVSPSYCPLSIIPSCVLAVASFQSSSSRSRFPCPFSRSVSMQTASLCVCRLSHRARAFHSGSLRVPDDFFLRRLSWVAFCCRTTLFLPLRSFFTPTRVSSFSVFKNSSALLPPCSPVPRLKPASGCLCSLSGWLLVWIPS